MQLDKLQIELRPRSNAQALDLGLALLQAQGGDAYRAWLALWLPVMALCALLCELLPDWIWLWFVLAWWVRPLLERAPLYVLSRQAFGDTVSWREAVRAWPRQLGGGTFELLTWGRIFSAGRCLVQPVWQLEMARGKVARARRKLLKRDGSGAAAFWFGVVCVVFQLVLAAGVFAGVGMFFSHTEIRNPLALLLPDDVEANHQLLLWVGLIAFTLSGAVIGPIYTACGFTLYLNRRARLEAWDIEIALRQIAPPVQAPARSSRSKVAAWLLAPLLVLGMGPGDEALAASAAASASASASAIVCDPPAATTVVRAPLRDPAQAAARKAVDKVYQHEDLRGYECQKLWRLKDADKDKKDEEKDKDRFKLPGGLAWMETVLKILAIALLAGALVWLLVRYRDRLPGFSLRREAAATEVAGLDIRASSLPDDVPAAVRALWAQGEKRAALALLFRATLARMVDDNGLMLRQGATEGDCLRAARKAETIGKLPGPRLAAAETVTMLWLQGAYGDRWPDDASVESHCRLWQERFGSGRPA